MTRKCFMCGREISSGIVCEKCDKPRKKTSAGDVAIPADPFPTTQDAHALDPFPFAPVVPFPVENASPAITSVVDILVASGVPAILLGPDKSVKFVTEEAKTLFDASRSDFASIRFVEEKTGVHIADLSMPASEKLRVRDRNIIYSLVPISGGAGGAALIFRSGETPAESQARAAVTPKPVPGVTDVVRVVAERFAPYAAPKAIDIQVDVPEIEQQFADYDRLAESLAILMDNAIHYVPFGGQVVIGMRSMEHKGKPLLLFFVMDNGPLVQESLRQVIFEPSFVWNPTGLERTGRGLFKCREFANSHAGSVWVESKTGKACTFFLRVRPDNVSGSDASQNVF